MTVVLLSGGLDSTTALAKTIHESPGTTPVVAVSADYGQRHRRELKAARAVADYYDVEHRVLDMTAVLGAVSSSLTDRDIDVPEGHYSADSMKATVVPGRNLLFLAAAASYAQAHGHHRIVIGVHAGDHPVYADCRPAFITAAAAAIEASSDRAVQLSAPFVERSKANIVDEGVDLGAPLHLSWSCYKGGEIHCGRCGTCVERAEAFHLAGAYDPTEYADARFWLTAVKQAAA